MSSKSVGIKIDPNWKIEPNQQNKTNFILDLIWFKIFYNW